MLFYSLLLQAQFAYAEIGTDALHFRISGEYGTRLQVPRGWSVQLQQPASGLGSQLTLEPMDGSLSMELTLLHRRPDAPPLDSAAIVRTIGETKLASSVEHEVVLNRFQIRETTGAYASFTDEALATADEVPPEAWRNLTIGSMRTGQLVVGMQLYSNSLVSEEYQVALQAWLSLLGVGEEDLRELRQVLPSLDGGDGFSYSAPALTTLERSSGEDEHRLAGSLGGGFNLTAQVQRVEGPATSRSCYESISSTLQTVLEQNRKASIDMETVQVQERDGLLRWDYDLLAKARPWKTLRMPQAWFFYGQNTECMILHLSEFPSGPRTQDLFSMVGESIVIGQ
jgi:hypothetical protein